MKVICAALTLLCSIGALVNGQVAMGAFNMTCANTVNQVFVDGVAVVPPFPPNYQDWSSMDSISIGHYTRLIAVRGVNTVPGSCSGFLATFTSALGELNSDPINWKCSASPNPNWQSFDFDDSDWEQAYSTGMNSEIVVGCSRVPIDGISLNAHWIWTTNYIDYDLVVSCRGYTLACTPSPCLNGGTCQMNTGSLCLCPIDFTGQFCETDFDVCASNPCSGNGQCQKDENGYFCVCDLNWTGENCETDLSECASDPCMNGATCTYTSPGWHCACPGGYTGEMCETDIDECESDPCLHGATCHDLVNGFTCTCAGGYTGNICQTELDECQSNPCQNGATCNNMVNGYTCSCYGGYTGNHCETGIGNCISNPCLNGGTCIDDPLAMDPCVCPPTWQPPYCQVGTDPCYSNPCKYGGTCIPQSGVYNCTCGPALEGDNCETATPDCGDVMAQSALHSPADGYWALCHITSLQAEYASTPCRDLLVNIKNYGNAADIIAGGGAFGCYTALNEADTVYACADGYNNDITLSACGVMCNYLGVCIRVGPLP